MTVALAVLLLAGAWAVLGSNTGDGPSTPPEQNAGQEKAPAPSGEEARNPEPRQEPADDSQNEDGGPGAGGSGSADEEPAEASQDEPDPEPAPALPPGQAEQAVFDMYYEMSFARADTSWAYLSERLQNEIGSVDQWAEQQDIYTFTYMEFEGYQYPVAEVSGDEAEVAFEVRLDHTWGSEIVTGTWVCVNEGGEWKLDRLVDDTTSPV